ncbi:long-chain fatty acid--CoA ligase [Streptomyces sp. P38-E01]|uniref:Long-chain fatty acid--CoA ligase n=1 Tax=Streptomyces tardus TaxID=2780544 RepID=A0A949JFM6_9ACTN|nr:long-chain fatty acid--CoA ligase [Streptomyces tardus]MBU7597629.1 long-chain fatty acid--CoA ligase [Streptomyces tardus]
MQSTMQDVPLAVSRILEHGRKVHGQAQVTTWTGEAEPHRRTFAEIGDRAAQLAHALRDKLGVEPGSVLGTMMWNNAEHVEAYLAIPSMGAVLHTLNLRLPPEQLVWIVGHAADRVVLVNGTLLPLLAPLLPRLPSVEHVVVVGEGDRLALDSATVEVHDYEELLAEQPTRYEWPEIDERAGAALCYTSGTTGDPKGVLFSHRSIYLHAMHVNSAEAFGLGSADLALPVVPMFHVNAWGLPHACFMSGAGMLMTDRFLQPGPIAEMIEKVRPTLAAAVPTIWQGLLTELDATERDVSSLGRVVIGGSACPPSLMRAFKERYDITVVHAWGMTETSPLGTVSHAPPGVGEEEAWEYRFTQGRLPASVEVRLASPDGTFAPWDGRTAGELEVRGPWIAAAYYGGAGSTEPLRPLDKFSEDGWLRTGDVGTISPNGYLTLTDRAKDVIKSGGEWISSVELENHLMAHPAVAEAAVVAVPDEKWGERPLATVVLAEGAEATYPELREYLAERVARWQVPERWTVIPAVPKTSVGKFDKKVLRAQYADGALNVTTL